LEQDQPRRRGDGLRPSLTASRRRRRRKRFLLADVVVVIAVAVVIGVLVLAGSGARVPRGAIRAEVGPPLGARPIPSGFLGLSLELSALEPYAGTDASAINPVFEQLVRNLSSAPVLRLGGDTTDWSWWPAPGMTQPPGVTFSLTPRWMQVAHAFASALHAR
jgi:hypothetical protein